MHHRLAQGHAGVRGRWTITAHTSQATASVRRSMRPVRVDKFAFALDVLMIQTRCPQTHQCLEMPDCTRSGNSAPSNTLPSSNVLLYGTMSAISTESNERVARAVARHHHPRPTGTRPASGKNARWIAVLSGFIGLSSDNPSAEVCRPWPIRRAAADHTSAATSSPARLRLP